MKTILKLHMVLLCLIFSLQLSFAQILEKKVTIQFQNITLDQALKKIKTTYGVNFSFSPDQINLNQKVSLNVSNVSLNEALKQLFGPTPITYRAVGNQIVLKRGKTPTTSTSGAKSVYATKPAGTDTTSKKIALKDTTENKQLTLEAKPLVASKDTSQAKKQLDNSYSKELTDLNSSYTQKKDSVSAALFANKTKLKQSWKAAKIALANEYKQLKDSILVSKKNKEKIIDSTVVRYDDDLLMHDTYQVTGVYPFGTHMQSSGLYRNDLSFNTLVGYNGAVSGFELGLLGNVVHKEVHGTQLAGIFNTTGEYVRGAQVAGVVNVSSQEVIGGQIAGLVNVAGGAVWGAQIAGVVNVGTEQLDGVQISGVLNQHNGTIYGGQIGLVNNARKVSGFQLGFINICDTIKGVPIGLLSIAKNGYGRVEGYYSETTQANILIKTGVKKFYNIFQFGTNFNKVDYYRWTFGYGFGSTVHMSKRSTISFDVLAMHINENEAFTNKLNEQGQLRIMFGVNISNRVSLFIGPTFNTSFSQFTNPDGTIGSKMIPKESILYQRNINTSDGKVIYNPYWLGINAGIRF
jgi:hypothetical protein